MKSRRDDRSESRSLATKLPGQRFRLLLENGKQRIVEVPVSGLAQKIPLSGGCALFRTATAPPNVTQRNASL